MLQLINEWQLKGQLNQALQHNQRADFALWLAMLSPAVDEMAAFCLADSQATKIQTNLYQQLGVVKARDFAMQANDIACLTAQHQAFLQDGLTQCRLQSLLSPPALVVKNDAKKLSAEVLDNLEFHTQRHMNYQEPEVVTTDPTALYDILQAITV